MTTADTITLPNGRKLYIHFREEGEEEIRVHVQCNGTFIDVTALPLPPRQEVLLEPEESWPPFDDIGDTNVADDSRRLPNGRMLYIFHHEGDDDEVRVYAGCGSSSMELWTAPLQMAEPDTIGSPFDDEPAEDGLTR